MILFEYINDLFLEHQMIISLLLLLSSTIYVLYRTAWFIKQNIKYNEEFNSNKEQDPEQYKKKNRHNCHHRIIGTSIIMFAVSDSIREIYMTALHIIHGGFIGDAYFILTFMKIVSSIWVGYFLFEHLYQEEGGSMKY